MAYGLSWRLASPAALGKGTYFSSREPVSSMSPRNLAETIRRLPKEATTGGRTTISLSFMYDVFMTEVIEEYYRAHPEAKRYCKLGWKKLKKWLVTSVDTDQWIVILLAMGTGKITADGDDAVDVTVARHVKSSTEYIHVNRILRAIADLNRVREACGLAF